MVSTMIELDNGDVYAYFIDLKNAPLILMEARKGYVMNGYLDIETSNKLGDIAGIVTDVNNFEDFLKSNIVELSNKAKKIGLRKGMKSREFLNRLF